MNAHCTYSFPPLPFFEGESWVNWENWVGLETNFFKKHQGERRGERENTKFVGAKGCFCFFLF